MIFRCIFGIHSWHATAPIFERQRLSKLICTRCGIRKWWRRSTLNSIGADRDN